MEQGNGLLRAQFFACGYDMSHLLERLFVIVHDLPGWWLGVDDQRTTRPYVAPERWDEELRKTGFMLIISKQFLSKYETYHNV
jgi:hypothetical protein